MPDKATDVAGIAGRLLLYVGGLHVEQDVHPVLVPLPAHGALPHLIGEGRYLVAPPAQNHVEIGQDIVNFDIFKTVAPTYSAIAAGRYVNNTLGPFSLNYQYQS